MIGTMRWTGVALAVLAGTLATGCYERKVSQGELEELFSGSTVRGKHSLDFYDFERHYAANGTFDQTAGPEGRGTWWIAGNQVCINWRSPHPKSGRNFCRWVLTNDKGRYWKLMKRRNGDKVTVVEYHSFTGADGKDLRRIPGFATYLKRWMLTWRGLVVLLVFLVILYFLLRHRDRPHSLRNRMRRRMFGVKAGGKSYSAAELSRMDGSQLGPVLGTCVREGKWVDAAWVSESLFHNTPSRSDAVASFWKAVEPCNDETAARAIEMALPQLGDAKTNIAATDGDVRFAYLTGKAFAAQAQGYQRQSSVGFESAKKSALEHYEHVRSSSPGAPPQLPELGTRSAPYRESAYPPSEGPNYGLLVGAAYESMLYTNYIAPPKPSTRSSSSYSGGG